MAFEQHWSGAARQRGATTAGKSKFQNHVVGCLVGCLLANQLGIQPSQPDLRHPTQNHKTISFTVVLGPNITKPLVLLSFCDV